MGNKKDNQRETIFIVIEMMVLIFLFGVVYGLASLTCKLPLFLAVVGSVFTNGGIAQAIGQFLAYSLGMGIVLIALTISLAFFKGVLAKYLRTLVPYVERISAVLLLGAGGYIIYYWLFTGRLLQRIFVYAKIHVYGR